jgi:hypothetical protein
MQRSCAIVLAVMSSLTLSMGGARAAVIDQQNTVGNSYLGPSSSPGQSFTPGLDGIDFATFSLATSDPVNGELVFAALHEGDGFDGTTLSASENDVLVQNTGGFQDYEFDFSPTVSLVPGDVYTLQLIDATGQNLFELEGSGNPYTGGQEYNSEGVAQADYDMVFSEGVVPEPTLLGSAAFLAVPPLAERGRRRSKRPH